MPRPVRVTLEAISRELNISTSSVSRALRNDPLIHPETRAQVNAVAMRMGYQGRSRRGPQNTSRQRTVCVLFAGNSLTDVKSGPVTMSYLQGMTSEADPANLTLNIQVVPQDPPFGASQDKDFTGISLQGDADIVIVSGRHDPARIAALAKSFSLISFVRAYENVSHDLVSTDDLAGVGKMVKKLAGLGHSRLLWVSFEEQSSYSRTRRAGFMEGCMGAGLDLSKQILLEGVFRDGNLHKPEKILAALKKGVTAIVTASDHAAYEISELLAREKISVPGDVSLTGFDAIGEPGRRSLAFTTYDPQFVEMGRVAILLALWRLGNASAAPMQVTVGGRLIEGETVAPAKAARRRG
jgi:LacI family transcriptional regulator